MARQHTMFARAWARYHLRPMRKPAALLLPAIVLTLSTACHDSSSGHNGDGGSTDGPPGSPPCTGLPLKTSRAPRLLWTCERQAFLTKLHDTNDPQWQELLDIANRSGTSDSQYADLGGYAALVYQITGDMSYAKKARDQMVKQLSTAVTYDGNYYRDEGTEYAVIYDWIQDTLSADDKKMILDIQFGWIDQLLKQTTPIRTTDTDATVGGYFGPHALAIAASDDPRAAAILANPLWSQLDSTASSFDTPRDSINMYITNFAKGGVWMESSYYDPNTLQLVGLGYEALRTGLGEDHFPEFSAYAEPIVKGLMHEVTGDFKGMGEWGDIDTPRDVDLITRCDALAIFIGLLPASSAVRPLAVQYLKDLRAQAKANGTKMTRARLFYFFDPTADASDYRAALPTSYYADGQGMMFARQGWGKDDTYVFMHMRRPLMTIDHENNLSGNFQMYRKGADVLTNPLGYDGGAITPQAVNSLVLGGLDAMMGTRKVVGYTGSSDGSFAYFAGQAQGPRYDASYTNPPPEFVHEWTRSFVYLSSTMHTADTLLVYDRVDADHPSMVSLYSSEDRALIMAATNNKVSIVHALSTPTVAGGHATWTASSQQVELTMLAPLAINTAVVDESTITAWPSGQPENSERHFYVQITPTTDQVYDTFLNVLQVSDAAVGQKPVRVVSADNGMEGALIARPGQPDAVVLFSATQGARIRQTAFSFPVTPGSTGYDLYIADLDVSKGWSSSAGGDLVVDGGGLARVTIPNGGAQTVTISPK
jgi:hypothetical protein